MSDTQQLLWEVGCEELPAWACEQLAQQVPGLVREELESARLLPVGGDGTDSTSAISVLVFFIKKYFLPMMFVCYCSNICHKDDQKLALR